MNDRTLCLSTACRDRKTCQRHWQHHEGSQENPRQSYTTFDGSYGKERCEGYVERKEAK